MKTAYKRVEPGFVGQVANDFELQTTFKLVSITGENWGWMPNAAVEARKEKVEQMTTLTRKDCWVLLGLMGAVVGVPALLCWLGYEALLWIARSLHIL